MWDIVRQVGPSCGSEQTPSFVTSYFTQKNDLDLFDQFVKSFDLLCMLIDT